MNSTVEEIYRRNAGRPKFTGQDRIDEPVSFSGALERANMSGKLGIIAEFKRFSPSGFSNRSNLVMLDYQRRVLDAGADALSVLTEPDFFGGNYDDISASRQHGVPLLAKDFFSDSAMIHSAYNCGADAILLIADFLSGKTLMKLCDDAHGLGMEVIVEFHDIGIGKDLAKINPDMIGYNRRNLQTLTMEGREQDALRAIENFDGIKILESGINMNNFDKVIMPGYDAVLIGEALLGNQDLISRLHDIRVS
ncbi:MAG: hypothetical protein B2I17_05100 [Thermoplasmatales archaeon B_DKE]|nr:MAG: hypothetical protein B2I17_05100 [Thermoplasmatales archaeon B_DKE]